MTLEILPSRDQGSFAQEPYDRWVTPEGQIKAEFYRAESDFIMRFVGDADFRISEDCSEIRAIPTHQAAKSAIEDLYRNAVVPVVSNHMGGLCLHGSAVSIGGSGTAFVGRSRSGKTTLAGALAKAGHAFLTEDVVDLRRTEDQYEIQAKDPVLRLMPDSASYLFGEAEPPDSEKQTFSASATIPHRDAALKLAAIFILEQKEPSAVQMEQLTEQQALAELLQHSFILDVEDKQRLGEHFSRLADLVQSVPCYSLDYRRKFATLDQVVAAIPTLFQE